GFTPVRYPINDEVKELVRTLLGPDEPVIVTVANESDSITLLATTQRVFSIRTGATAGVTGFTVRDFTWDALTDMRLQQAALNVVIALHFQSKDGGRTAETGIKAKFAKPAVDKLMPFETNAGTAAFEAIHAVWHHKRNSVGEA
ncbi:MAG TPA: hypothetical protein VF719_09425, partial [Abditibacteriaceae bacterium]